MTARMSSNGLLLLCVCMASLARAAILPTDLEARVGAHYQPANPDEQAIWQNLAQLEETIRTSPQRLIAPELDAYAHRVLERLLGRPAPELRIYVMRDASFNAAMFPTGMLILNTGVLARVRSEAQLAVVLGHEVGHYLRKHSLDRFHANRHKASMMELVAAAGGSTGKGYRYGGQAWEMINHANVESVFKFSRKQESEADAFGIALMARAGYPPRAAATMCEQLIDERRASAAARSKRFFDGASAGLSTHPATQRRIDDLADTADHLARKSGIPGGEGRDEWAAVIRPHLGLLLREQINLNDPGASLYLLEELAKGGWTGLLRFNEGEVYRLRNTKGDDLKAAAAYAAATALADAPPAAWRAQGYALLKAGKKVEASQAFDRYFALEPDAPDAAMIRATFSPRIETVPVPGGLMSVDPGAGWTRLPANANETQWDEVWTFSGPQVDRMALVGGLPEGKAIISQQKDAASQAPVFRADMTAQDLMSMLEVSYRVRSVTMFSFESVAPVDFLGGPGVRLRYRYASGIGIPKRGICVMRIIDQKLYAMKLESVAGRSFDAVAQEFDLLAANARLGR